MDIFNQKSKLVNIATPLFTQNFSSSPSNIGNYIVITKFEERPVVVKTPNLYDVI
jgi:hypothetical protein